MLSKGELLFQGVARFPAATGADGAMRVIDVPVLGAEDDGIVEVAVRNGSASEILAVDVGGMRKFRPYPKDFGGKWMNAACADTLATLTTLKPHGLKVGDRVIFDGTGGGLTANLYYYVVDPLFLMTDFVFQVSATPGGTVFNIDSDTETNNFRYLPSPISAIPSAAGVIATDVYNCATPHGLTVGDAVILDANATVDVVAANTVYYVIATATALQFQISATRGGTTLDVAATTAVALKLAPEFVSLTTFAVPKFAAGTYLVNVAGLASKIVQGFAASPDGGRICISPGDQTYVEFAASVEIRRA
ncbi:MAG TPA: hypothetical protein VMX94_06120 [Armatimonadota bacterium]|nr:hypothetical protein [Armatimonadota bacterium]